MMQSQQAYTKDIKLGDSEVLVVENEEQVLCHTDSKTRYCVLGSTHHASISYACFNNLLVVVIRWKL